MSTRGARVVALSEVLPIQPPAIVPVPAILDTETRLTRACEGIVLGGYALAAKIEALTEALARALQSRGIM